MPRKKIEAIESPRNSKKNVSLTLQNEENKGKSNNTVKKKKPYVRRSRKKEVTGLPTPFESVGEIESPVASVSKKPRRKISTTKSPRNSKKKILLSERNMNVNNTKSYTTVKKKKICVRRSSGKNEMTGLPSIADPFQFIASPATSCSKKPRNQVITRKSSRNSKKKNLLATPNVNEKNENSECTDKMMTHCSTCPSSGIREVAAPSLIFPPLQIVKEFAFPTTSSSKKPRRKVLKTKSSQTPRKRKLPSKQRNHENEGESDSTLQSEVKESDVSFVMNISSAEDIAVLKEVAAASAEQVDPEINEENDSNMKKKKECDLQLGDRDNDVPIVVHVSPTKDVAFVKEISSTATSTVISKNVSEVHEMRCMICLKLESCPIFTTMSCGHSFHSLCLQTWFEVKKSCPACNPEISANDDASNNSEIGDTVVPNDINRNVTPFNCIEKGHTDPNHIDSRTVNEFKKLNEDINEFLMRCVICMGTSRSHPFGDSHDQVSDFEVMPCSHNVHAACARMSSGVKKECPVCMENSRIGDDSIYEFPEEMRCVICLDTVESSNFEYISCCHSFHHQCIQNWFTVRRGEICPVCMVSCSSNVVEDESLYGFLENVRCTICMDIEEFSEFQRLSCRHSFHTVCAQTWFQENSYCPTCMRSVSLDTTEIEDEDDVRCVICVDTEESSVFEFLSCCHSFHAVCIKSWLKKGKSCPICNTRILDISNTVENVRCAAACN